MIDPPAATQRKDELRLIAEILQPETPPPGWTFPYISRGQCDSRRTPETLGCGTYRPTPENSANHR